MRRWHVLALATAVPGGAVALVACSPFSSDDAKVAPVEVSDAGDMDPAGINTTGVGAGTGADTNLPCDVQQLLENRCIGCHLATSRLPLLSYDDLMKLSKSDPEKSMADVALARMQDTSKPMPPLPAAAPVQAEIDTLKSWLGMNAPKGGACTPPEAPDAGADTTSYNTPVVCTSGKMWTGIDQTKGGKKGSHAPFGGFGGFGPGPGRDDESDDGSPLMDPGHACVTCHSVYGGPSFQVAGTIYPTAHEPDNCNGVNAGVEVVITDAKGAVTTIPANSVGNFYSSTPIAAPYRVKVRRSAAERVMATAITSGDCNSCHTETGVNGAPGRILAP